jgi:hypothetical protein
MSLFSIMLGFLVHGDGTSFPITLFPDENGYHTWVFARAELVAVDIAACAAVAQLRALGGKPKTYRSSAPET